MDFWGSWLVNQKEWDGLVNPHIGTGDGCRDLSWNFVQFVQSTRTGDVVCWSGFKRAMRRNQVKMIQSARQ